MSDLYKGKPYKCNCPDCVGCICEAKWVWNIDCPVHYRMITGNRDVIYDDRLTATEPVPSQFPANSQEIPRKLSAFRST